jgi:hypothetical protein
MTKDEILNAIQILKALPNVKEAYTAEIDGHWVPFIGIEMVTGDYVKLESLDEVFLFAVERGLNNSRKH